MTNHDFVSTMLAGFEGRSIKDFNRMATQLLDGLAARGFVDGSPMLPPDQFLLSEFRAWREQFPAGSRYDFGVPFKSPEKFSCAVFYAGA